MKTSIGAVILFIACIPQAFAWDRFEVVDEFSDEKTFGYIQKSSNAAGGFLIISCDKKINFEWALNGSYAEELLSKSSGADATQTEQAPRVAQAAQAPRAAMAMDSDLILIKTDKDPIRKEQWVIDNLHESFGPMNTAKFFAQIKEKAILKFKHEQLNQTGVFDISELTQITAKLTSSCK